MSSNCKVIFERGRFFIETGSAKGFSVFFNNGSGILKYIPPTIIKRIEDLIRSNNTDTATALWTQACTNADKATTVLFRRYLHIIIHILEVISMAVFVYAFFKILS